MYALFDQYDADGSGSIEITELRRLLEDVTAREERASGRQKEERASSSGLVPQEQYKDVMETATQYTSPPPSPPSAEAQAVTASRKITVTPTASPDNSFSQERHSSRRRTSSKELFEAARRSSSNESVVTTSVKRELAKVSQELLDQSQMWRLKTYYVFPVVEKMRHLDHISRFVFPIVYAVYLLAMLSEVNFGADQRKLLESKMDCYAGQ